MIVGLALICGSVAAQRPTQGVGGSQSRGVNSSDVLLSGALVQTMPADGAVGVSLDRNTSLFFTAPLDPTTVSDVSIAALVGASPLPTELTLSDNRRVVTVEYPFFLPENATIEVRVHGDLLRSELGREIDADADGEFGGLAVIQFQTGPGIPTPITTSTATILGSVFDTAGDPLANAAVELWFYPRTPGAPPLAAPVMSDAAGAFQLETVAFTGSESFLVAINRPGHTETLRRVDLLAGGTRRVADATLQLLDSPTLVTATAGASLQDSGTTVTLVIPPDALSADSTIAVTVLSRSEVLRDQLPPRAAGQGVFVDVSGVAGDQADLPVTLQIPNTYDLPIGTRVPFGRIDPHTLQWNDVRDLYTGTPPVPDEFLGTVLSGGAQGTFIEVQLDRFGSIAAGYGLPLTDPVATDNSGGGAAGESSGGSVPAPALCLVPQSTGTEIGSRISGGTPPVDQPGVVIGDAAIGMREGYLWTTLELPAMRELGRDFGISLGYFSAAASPSVTLAAQVDYGIRPVERTVFSFEIEGSVAEGVYDFFAAGEQPIGTFLWTGVDGLGQQLSTGAYPFAIEATSLNAAVQVALPDAFADSTSSSFPGAEYPGLSPQRSSLQGRAVLVDLTDSPYGAGWSVLEEQRVHPQPDGQILLVQGNGDWRLFAPDPTAPKVYLSPPGEFSTLIFNSATGGFVRSYPDGRKLGFNAAGRLESIADRYNNVTTWSYTGDLLTGIDSPTGYQLTLTYDASGGLSRIEDSALRGTDFVVDGAGDLVSATGAGLTQQFGYDPDHLLTSHTGPRGERSEFTYDQGRVVRSEDFDTDGTTLLRGRTFAPSALAGEVGAAAALGVGTIVEPIPVVPDRTDSMTDGRGVVIEHRAGADGQTELRRDGLGRPTAYTYSSRQLASLARPDGSLTTYEYGSAGSATAIRELSDAVTEYSVAIREYQGTFAQLSRNVDAENKETHFTYDEWGNLLTIQDHNGNLLRLVYEEPTFRSLPSRITLRTGENIDLTYDAHGNLLTVTDYPDPFRKPGGRTLRYAYDAAGNVISVIARNDEITRYTYDDKNRITSIEDNLLRNTAFDYGDAGCGCASTVTFPGLPTIRFEYDGLGRRTSRFDQFDNLTTYTYNPEGNLTARLDRNGDAVTYVYDDAGQLAEKHLPGPEITFYQRDLLGRVLSAANPTCILETTHDFLGRIETAKSVLDLTVPGGAELPVEHVITYGYDRVGNRTSMVDDTGLVSLTYTYDDLHRLTGLLESNIPGGTWSLVHDLSGRRRVLNRPNAVATVYTYDLVGRLLGISHGATPAISLGYGPADLEGNQLSEGRTGGSQPQSSSWTYDGVSQLDSGTIAQAFGDTEVDRNYTVDLADRLLDDEDFTYTYDLEGRLIARDHQGSDVTDRYQYDAEGRLRQHTQEVDVLGVPDTVLTVNYEYDPLGRRYRKSVNGVVTKYVYDGTDVLHELDGQNRIVRTFTHGFRSQEPLAMRDRVTDQTLFFHADRLGNVIALSDTFGTLVEEYFYDEYGNPLSAAGPEVPSRSYTSREQEPDSGLFLFGDRYYNPTVGRFLTPNPADLRSALNLYRYAHNNPTNRVEPTTRETASDIAARSAELARRIGMPSLRLPR